MRPTIRLAVLSFLALSTMVLADELAPEVKMKPMEFFSITAANIRGQQSLYREGWFFVSSTENALAYAKAHSLTESSLALAQVRKDLKLRNDQLGLAMSEVGEKSLQTGADVFQGGTALTKRELDFTKELARAEIDYGSDTMQRAWTRLIKGNLSLAQRTQEDRTALAALPGKYFGTLKNDFSNIHELSDKAKQSMATHIEGRWSEGFAEAQANFGKAYERSGERKNSLTALGDIIVGYGQAIYSGLFKPAARSTVQGAEASVKLAGKAVFLPVAGLFVVTGRTIQSAGMSLYYTTAMGVKLVSPTVEGGLLAGLSLATYGAAPVTIIVGGTLGAVNQIAVTAAAPVAAAGRAATSTVADTTVYAAQVSYDLVAGATKVTLNQTQSGVVLGYNALTALPVQTLLGVTNGAVFLAWDGPRLVIATAKGEVAWRDAKGAQGSVAIESLPVGSVVDLQALGKESGVAVQVIEDNPEVIENVLEKLPQDLRVGDQP